MSYVLSTYVGSYHSHTITVGEGFNSDNHIDVEHYDTSYSGIATEIVDTGDTLSFKDKDGKKHEYLYRCSYYLTTT